MTTEADAIIRMGRIVGLFGVKGWVKVFSYTDPRQKILDYPVWLVDDSGAWTEVRVLDGKRQGKGVIAQLDGNDDRDSAASLIGKDIAVRREALPVPDSGQFYWSDLEGLSVRRTDGEVLGTVSYMLATGANDVMVVKGERERLIPFLLHDTIVDVDLAAGEIVVDWEWNE